ncbi:leucine-rich repeat receptor-like protein kinase PEPR2 [Gossypium australe]|uniref:Leucine-rich repeat receptor-like protein kinase PEPR2 n=1 Tax=Gossypium australe TaxID=47621 RepID=A0A5B6WNR8_9ROSI|nr:leucine-rich repeat receptor-like protein kinase PEPR2 [Gossypium australe]
MELTVVKLLGRNIGYNALHNRISFLWKPVNPIQLMDIANGYYLVKFQDADDYNRVLTKGPWVVYGRYLTVQPWTKQFRYLYKRKIVEAIGSLIGKVVKLHIQTDNQARGRFARLVVYINLENPLISQRVEYEGLPTVCFACCKYGHFKETCPSVVADQNSTRCCGEPLVGVDLPTGDRSDGNSTISKSREKEPKFRPWMLVEKKSSRRGKKGFIGGG